jgi:NitT/TauT family transport system substrate-binding protein
MKTRTKHSLVGAILMSLGCGLGSPAVAADQATLRLNFLLSGVHSIFYYGKQQGVYSAEGINLTIGEGQGSVRTVQVVATGSDTFGVADGGSVIAGATRGAPVVSVMGILNTSPYGISFRADAGVSTIKDVEGKTIAVQNGEASLPLLAAVWKANGIDASKVKTLNVDGPGKIVAILQKRVDGTLAGLENQVIVLNQKGLDQKVFSFAELGVNTEGLTIIANQSTIDQKPDLVARFVRATRKAIDLTKANPDQAVEAAFEAKPQSDKALLKDQLIASLKLLNSPTDPSLEPGVMAPEDWKRTLDLMKQYQDVQTDLPAEQFYTNRFVKP